MTVTYMRRDYTLQESSFEVTHLVDCGRKLVEFLVSEHVEVLDGWMFDNGEEFGNNTGEEQGREGSEEEGGDDDGSSIDLRNHLRDDILQTVDECLTAWEKGRILITPPADPLHRCAVCTLPHGSCRHSQQWLETRQQDSILDPLPKDNVDLIMEDISDVLTPTPVVLEDTPSPVLPPSLSTLRWEIIHPQPVDEIAGKTVDLSSPFPRAGHTMVQLDGAQRLWEDTRLLVIFGGVSLASSNPLQPDSSTISKGGHEGICLPGADSHTRQALSYHSDVRVFHVGLATWHCPKMTGELPDGRYGHVSLALDGETMWMFGGRLQGGRQEGHTYVLDVQNMRWEITNRYSNRERSPVPRAWSAAVKVRERVILFGGADLCSGSIFDDVWVWDTETRHWEEQIVVGIPPRARYGHALVCGPTGKVLVMGGCCVSTTAEKALPANHELIQRQVRVAAHNVNRAYELEDAEVAVGSFANLVELGGSLSGGHSRGKNAHPVYFDPPVTYPTRERWKYLSRTQAKLAAAVAARERDTALHEEQLRVILHEKDASIYWARLQSCHPFKDLDVTFLDTDSMIWGTKISKTGGSGGKRLVPAARMYFSAVVLGQKVVVWGGCLPISKRVETVEGGVHVFDMISRRWTRPVGDRHPEGIQPRIDAARLQLRRAERSIFEAKQRAMTLGAPGGRTMQVVQAEAMMAVNQWRFQTLKNEFQRATPSPHPRAGHAGCALGHRIMYFGGWSAGEGKGELLVLDVERPSEKERRLEEEFHLRLERERQVREGAEVEALRRTALQETMRKDLELRREASERALMTAEDARSAIPELTIAPTPRLRCANNTALWVEWDRPAVDPSQNLPDDHVEYILYMRGGFREWEDGDNVLVEYISRAQRRAAATAKTTTASIEPSVITSAVLCSGDSLVGQGCVVSGGATVVTGSAREVDSSDKSCEDGLIVARKTHGQGENAQPRLAERKVLLLPAVVTNANIGGGLYDIRWDDGECERNVRRARIHRAATPAPPWTVVYQGEECGYAVQGMIPDAVVEREGAFPYEVSAEFSLQTKGTEVPRDKLSRHSRVVTLRTVFGGQRSFDGGHMPGARGGGSLKTRLAAAKILDESISANEGITISSSSDLHSHLLHGQYMGTGRGRLYL